MTRYDASTYIVFLDLPADIAGFLDAIRAEVDAPGLKRWVAHITLKQDANYLSPLTEILQRLGDFCFFLQPFQLTLTGLQFKEESDGDSWSIFVGIKEKELLQKMTKTLSKLLTPLTETSPHELIWEQTEDYYPHVTIIHGHDISHGKSLFARLNTSHKIEHSFRATSVTLAHWDKTKWEKVQSFPLSEKV